MAAASGAETQAVLDEFSNEIDRFNQENAALRQRVRLPTRRRFGRRSEKGVAIIEQGVLPFEPAVAEPVQAETTDESRQAETAEPAHIHPRFASLHMGCSGAVTPPLPLVNNHPKLTYTYHLILLHRI